MRKLLGILTAKANKTADFFGNKKVPSWYQKCFSKRLQRKKCKYSFVENDWGYIFNINHDVIECFWKDKKSTKVLLEFKLLINFMNFMSSISASIYYLQNHWNRVLVTWLERKNSSINHTSISSKSNIY